MAETEREFVEGEIQAMFLSRVTPGELSVASI
jgi:hypothetical protein